MNVNDINKMDKDASRNFKATTLTMNEYEHSSITLAAERAGYKSVKQFIRDACLKESNRVLRGENA